MNFKDMRATWLLAWPIAVGQLASTGTAFVDAVMAGHVSAEDLAAVSVGSSIWVTLIVTIIGYLLAASPMIAQKLGARDHQAIPAITQQALLQAAVLAALAWIAAWQIRPVFPLLGLEPSTADKASRFLAAISFGLPGLACYRVLYSYTTALKQTKPIMFISVFCLLLNIPVNWILINGHLGFTALGGVGCGWATAFCVWVNLLLLSFWIMRNDMYRDTHPFRRWQGWHPALHRQLFKHGVPIGMMFLVEVSSFALIALIIARLGADSVAAHQIALNFSSLTFMVPMAIGTALTVRVGHAVGAHNYIEARVIGHNGIKLGLGIALATGTLMIFGSSWVAGWYTNDPATLKLAGQLILLAGFFQFSDITQVVSAGVLRGYKITRAPMVIHLTAFWLIGIPLGYVLTFGHGSWPGLGVRGYWIALIVALTFTALCLQYLFRRASHRLQQEHHP